jgi:exodeoxyribonuclease V alpha subunit
MSGVMGEPLPELVLAHVDAHLLGPGAVHLARTVARLAGETNPEVLLAVAYAAQAPFEGNAAVDLATVRHDVRSDDTDTGRVDSLVWPPADAWLQAVRHSPLAAGEPPVLVVRNSLVYLQRYDDYEHRVADMVRLRAAVVPGQAEPGSSSEVTIAAGLLTGAGSTEQLAAVRQARRRALSIIVGGPGTGKTTTVAALLAEVVGGAGTQGPRVALAAPTGKAAARLGEALRQAAASLPEHTRSVVADAPSSTLHRLIGWSTRGTPRFHGGNPLPYDLVIIDETSMVSLPLMARVLDALRPDARLVLVGDPGQLASVEAGTVLSDLVLGAAGGPLSDCITELVVSRRFPPGSPLDRVAQAVRHGDSAAALTVLDQPTPHPSGRGDVTWIDRAATDPQVRHLLAALLDPVTHGAVQAAQAGDGVRALDSLRQVRLLCAHRQGPFGVATWNQWVQGRMESSSTAGTAWYPGRPVMVTRNDTSAGLFNGDVGVVIRVDGNELVAFESAAHPEGVRLVSPARLDQVDTVHAMTIHKSQGSEFGHVIVILPPADSPLASRDLLYTAITRATDRVTLVGDRDAVTRAVQRRTHRIGGLAERLGAVDQAPTASGELR